MIIVGVDYSENSRAALEWALAEASVRGDKVHVVHSLAPPSDLVLRTHEVREQHTHAHDVLVAFIEQTRALHEFDATPTPHVAAGHAADVVRQVADDLAADMIVVGRRGLGTVYAALAGSVSRALTRSSSVPLVVVPQSDRAWQHPSRVVAGVDGSDESIQALRWAALEARLHGAQLLAVHAATQMMPFGSIYPLQRPVAVLDSSSAERVLEDAVGKLEADLGEQVHVEQLIVSGSAGRVLRDVSYEHDLLVVGRRGRGAVSRWLLGSTSTYCVGHVTCPVVVVP
jgi:nucleotide-binding universal stress UspA family protein